jgi:hypothetical protein
MKQGDFMKHQVGQKSKAICSNCGGLKSTTFMKRDVPLSSGKGQVSNILVGVCDGCDQVISTTQEAAPQIAQELKKNRGK